jgi:hypothetical protein
MPKTIDHDQLFKQLIGTFFLEFLDLFAPDLAINIDRDSLELRLPGLDVLAFNFLRVQLNQLNWRDFLKQKNPVAAALMSKMKIDPKERAKVKVECLRSIANLKLDPARVSILSAFVDSYLRLNAVEVVEFEAEVASIKKETQKEKVMQIVTSWMEQGIEQGEQKEALRLVSRVLTRRVGELEAGVSERLQQLSVSQLEDLLDAALDFTQVAEIESWLSQN